MKTFLTTLLLGMALSAFGQAEYTYKVPAQLTDGWAVDDLKANGIELALFEKFFNAIGKEKHQLHSMLLIRDNKLVMEEYFQDNDLAKRHDLRSVTKSITSLLVGIAVDKGFIKSIDDPVANYLSEFKDAKKPDVSKSKITLRHYLTMSSGMDCNDWDPKSKGQEDKLYKKKDWIQFMADLPMINEPGASSFYCTGGTILLAETIKRTSGLSLDQFAEKHLFEPMAITNISWGHTNKKKVLMSGKRLYMTPRDMAKIGQLIVNQGQWNGQQLVPENWINEISETKTQITGLDYSFLWWQLPFMKAGQRVATVCATGNGGQYIFAFPAYNLVAVFTGGAYNSPDDKLPFSIVNKVILSSIKE